MKILIYGFKPWKKLKTNISQEVLKKIKLKVRKKVFDVNFNKKQFVDEIKKANPDIIMGLGMIGKGEKIRIERKAINLKKESKAGKPAKISKKGEKYLFTSLKIKKDSNSRISYDARWYVCNFSMYIILDFIKYKNIKYGFIHIPKDYKVNKAVKFVENAIHQIP